MPPLNDNSDILCTCTGVNPDNFIVDLNEDNVGLFLKQGTNTIFNTQLKKVILEDRIIYRKKNKHNVSINLDEEISMKLYKQNGDIYYHIIFEPNSLNLRAKDTGPISEDNLKCCFIEYSEGIALTFNVDSVEGNKILPKNVYLTFKT